MPTVITVGLGRTIQDFIVMQVLAMLVYALAGGSDITVVWLLFLPFNMGIGFRGPPGFYRALQASGGDDARASDAAGGP